MSGRPCAQLPPPLLVAGGLAFAGCSKDDNPTAPGPPKLLGRVRVVGTLRDGFGNVVGSRVVQDADCLVVRLMHRNEVVAARYSVDGTFAFTEAAGEPWRAILKTWPVGDTSGWFPLGSANVRPPDTLAVGPRGDLAIMSNSFSAETRIRSFLPAQGAVSVSARSLTRSGFLRSLVDAIQPAGEHAITWDGRDNLGHVVPSDAYLVALIRADSVEANVAFRKPQARRSGFPGRRTPGCGARSSLPMTPG
jgi:hypothetical protein